ncbi:redoxin domain-containing protein [Carboxylicivirga sediminis]|uniref:Redoxin domain-containing protein n=1 Tax=Carboxylicivirga sediminis TaxID=2006564 RepID=A0A941IZF1_9BACT|nr:deiodinase-like protein [Carboxylicivirga sediminis]MBR8537810.1 redoxin domain-containing protein [Carboxylicivirga sediminis]
MKKDDLTKELRRELLSKDMAAFEEAIGFTEEEWHQIKNGLNQREVGMKATLNSQAPAFSVTMMNTEGEISGSTVSLADYKGRPLALVLGSYTCPVFRRHNSRINAIYEAYHNKAAFLHIYVYEMHPVNSWFIPINLQDDVVYDQPTTLAGRAAVARDWIKAQNIHMPVALDDMHNTVDELYAGSPERLYVIDSDGIIRFRSSQGPFDDHEVDQWEATLQQLTSHTI